MKFCVITRAFPRRPMDGEGAFDGMDSKTHWQMPSLVNSFFARGGSIILGMMKDGGCHFWLDGQTQSRR